MNIIAKTLTFIITCFIILTGCARELDNNCDFTDTELIIEPFCSFLPSANPQSAFPVRVVHQGEGLHSPEYLFKWSSDLDFGGSAISVSYEMLPLTVEVTEVSSECTASATLTSAYWE